MKVTIIGTDSFIEKTEKYEGVDYDKVTVKEIHKKNGYNKVNVRIERDKRAIVISSGVFHTITIQDEETGRYLLKYSE